MLGLVLYLLSCGPMVLLDKELSRRGVNTDSFLNIYYAPYQWLCKYTPLRVPLKAYGDCWVRKAGGAVLP